MPGQEAINGEWCEERGGSEASNTAVRQSIHPM